MKKILFQFFLFFFSINFSWGQTSYIKRIKDPALVNQAKRQVFKEWAEFLPQRKNKKFLGIFGNYGGAAWEATWGEPSEWLGKNLKTDTERNREYRLGGDIRPLKPNGGLETVRQGLVALQLEDAKEINKMVKEIEGRAQADFAHTTHLTLEADPLYMLYYKAMLKPVTKLPDDAYNLPHFTQQEKWFLKYKREHNPYYSPSQNGYLDDLSKSITLLKEKYDKAKKLDMPRGKRLIMLHEVLLDYRKLLEKIRTIKKVIQDFLTYEEKEKQIQKDKEITTSEDDETIANKVITKHKDKY